MQITPVIVFAGLIGAIVWNLATWFFGLPSSSSHALFGGLIGATVVGAGFGAIDPMVLLSKIVLPALLAPVIAATVALVATKLALRITRSVPQSRKGFARGQVFTSSLVSLAHGTNDAQKTMGVITLTLVAAGLQDTGSGPQFWVILCCAVAIALGTYAGGWRIIRTLGTRITEITPPQGFAAEGEHDGDDSGELAPGVRALDDPGGLGLGDRGRPRTGCAVGTLAGCRPHRHRLAHHPARRGGGGRAGGAHRAPRSRWDRHRRGPGERRDPTDVPAVEAQPGRAPQRDRRRGCSSDDARREEGEDPVIDWGSFVLVALVALGSATAIVTLFATGLRLLAVESDSLVRTQPPRGGHVFRPLRCRRTVRSGPHPFPCPGACERA